MVGNYIRKKVIPNHALSFCFPQILQIVLWKRKWIDAGGNPAVRHEGVPPSNNLIKDGTHRATVFVGPTLKSFSFYFIGNFIEKCGQVTMKRVAFQMSALNDKQLWLCDIMTRLPLIKYVEKNEEFDIVAHVLESPITGKPLSVWWHVESLPVVHRVFVWIWNSRMLYDKEAARTWMNW